MPDAGKRGRGRPPLPELDRRRHRHAIRFDDRELDVLTRLAADLDVDPSDAIRAAIDALARARGIPT